MTPLLTHVMDPKDARRYSLLRAIRSAVANRRAPDGLEGEVSQEIARRTGATPKGFYVPWDLPVLEQRDVTASGSSNAVATVVSADLITSLRNKLVLAGMGARIMPDMDPGNFSIPKQTAAGAAYWVSEGVAPTETTPAINGQVAFSPTSVGAYTDLSRKFVNQTSIAAEQLVRDDLAAAVAVGIDTAALNGSGTGAEPTGILQDGSVTTVSIGTNGGAPTWAKLIEMEGTVAGSSADIGSLGFVTNSKVRSALRTTPTFANGSIPIWDRDNTVAGYRTGVTNAVPSDLTKGTGENLSAAIFGNWADLVVAMWGGFDVIVDPSTFSTSGGVRVTVLQECQIKLRRTESFVKCVDLVAA